MILPIYLFGQSVLRKATEDVTPETEGIASLITNMQETLAKAEGCGLAAPQVGKSLRLFIIDANGMEETYPECAGFEQVFINPEILEESAEKIAYDEGCLSLPGIYESVTRPKTIRIKYLDANFKEHIETLTDFRARIFQHEFDHLQGHIFTDRIAPLRKQFLQTSLNKIAKGKNVPKYKCKV